MLPVQMKQSAIGFALILALSGCTGHRSRADLAVPDVRQSTGYTCGPAALQAVLAYYGIAVREDELSAAMGASSENGTTPEAIVSAARAHGLDAELRENLSVDDLRAELDANRPVIVEMQAWTDSPHVDWASDWDDGHYAVLVAFEGDELVFEDPSVLGSRAQLPRREFETRWHDIDFGRRHVHAAIVLRGKSPAPPPGRVRMQ
jgi:predicted double-glycine peptidase